MDDRRQFDPLKLKTLTHHKDKNKKHKKIDYFLEAESVNTTGMHKIVNELTS